MSKHILILGLILTALGSYIFWSNHRKNTTPQDAANSAATQWVHPQQGNTDTAQSDRVPPNKAQQINQTMRAFYADAGDLADADPEVQKLLEIFASSEFAKFIEESGEYTTDGYYGFLASQGIPWDRDAYYKEIQEDFQKHFPGETPEGIEPHMRQTLLNMIADNNLAFTDMLTTFLDEKTLAWMSARFPNSYREFGDWVAEIVIDYIEPPTTDTPAIVETETPNVPAQGGMVDEHVFDDRSAEPSESPIKSTSPPMLEESEVLTESDIAEIETEFLKSLEQTHLEEPEQFSTEMSAEKMLREDFSPRRLNIALQTLNRYGPEEGLRRLKKSDPEVARQIERFIQGNEKEND